MKKQPSRPARHKQIFVNLPVKDLNKSIEFFTKLGYKFDPQFTDQNATCMILGENMFVMLLARDFFKSFTAKEIADATKSAEAIVALSVESREAVDELVRKAREAGGTVPRKPQDQGWMYGHGFQDPDGHIWEVLYMDESAMRGSQT